MKRHKEVKEPNVIEADPSLWSKESQQSYASCYVKEYKDSKYTCLKSSLKIAHEIKECEKEWADSKVNLKSDRDFLSKWLRLLEEREKYTRYKENTAAKNMLNKLLNTNA